MEIHPQVFWKAIFESGVVNIGDRQNLREQNFFKLILKFDVLDIHKKLIKAIKIKIKLIILKTYMAMENLLKEYLKYLKNIKISEKSSYKKTTY